MSTFTVPGTPVAWARAARRADGRSYTPAKQSEAMRVVAYAAQAAGLRPLAGPVELNVIFAWAWPSSAPKSARGETRWRIGRPDVDNALKLIGDALNGVAWADDAQVVRVVASKVSAPEAKTIVTVTSLDHQPQKSAPTQSAGAKAKSC